MQFIFLDPLTIPACLCIGKAGFSQRRPCLLWKHWDLPSLGIHNPKVVYHRHMDSNATNAYCCAIQVQFAPTSGPMTSNDLLLLPPSMRKSVQPWGECWNHYQDTKKLEVKLTPGKIRCLRVDRARPTEL